MKRNRLLMVLVTLLLVLPVFALADYNPGVYEAVGTGNGGEVKIEVTFSEKAIESIVVKEHSETPGISDAALQNLPKMIVETQSVAVDAVSGATLSSNAILSAVKDAVTQAGGNVDELMTPVEKEVEAIDGESRKAEVEVLIIGGGGTGMSAAASAYCNGANKIMVVEKLGRLGGSTYISGGIQGATGTRYKKSQGSTDTNIDWIVDWVKAQDYDLNVLGLTCEYPNYDRVYALMGEATKTVNWVEETIGQKYTEGYMDYGNATKRVHILKEAVHDGVEDPGSGHYLGDKFIKYLDGKDEIDIRLNTCGKSLITNEAGDVIGAVVEDEHGSYEVYASKGVVLATGGFPYDHELLSQYLPVFDEAMALSAANSGNTGDGIKMALDIGAAWYNDPYVIGFGAGVYANLGEFASPVGLGTKMMVDKTGKRFVNEALSYSAITIALSIADTPTFAIADSTDANIALVDAAVDNKEIFKADTIEELAGLIGVDPAVFAETVEKYNAACDEGVDAEFGKGDAIYGLGGTTLIPIRQAPFYAVNVHPSNAGTIGGVKTNWNWQVLRDDGSIINGLYAGGECSNREYYAYTYMSGSGVTVALTSGRMIGEEIMSK